MANFYEAYYDESQTTQSAVDSELNQEQTEFSDVSADRQKLKEEIESNLREMFTDLAENIKTVDPVYMQSQYGEQIQTVMHDAGIEIARYVTSGLDEIKEQAIQDVANYAKAHPELFAKSSEPQDGETIDVSNVSVEYVNYGEVENVEEIQKEINDATDNPKYESTEQSAESEALNQAINEATPYESDHNRYSERVQEMVGGMEPVWDEIVDTWKNQKITDAQAWSDDTLSVLTNSVGNICDQAMGLFQNIATENSVISAVIDLPNTVGDLIETAVTDPLNRFINDIFGSTNYLVDGVTGGLMNIVNDTTGAVGEWANKHLDKASDFVDDIFKGVVDEVINLRQNAETGLRNLLGLPVDGDPDYKDYKFKEMVTLQLQNARKGRPTRNSYFSKSLELRNEMYWDITIEPFKDIDAGADSEGPPDFRGAFGISTGEETGDSTPTRLPIISFNMVGGTSVSTELEMYPGMSLIYPSQYNLPSRLTISLPEVIYSPCEWSTQPSQQVIFRDVTAVLQKFKNDYLNWVYIGREKSDSEVKVRDFRKCAYKITVRAYSQDWREAYRWEYLGVPEISDTNQGSSTSSIMTTDITFNIVGENYVSTNTANENIS